MHNTLVASAARWLSTRHESTWNLLSCDQPLLPFVSFPVRTDPRTAIHGCEAVEDPNSAEPSVARGLTTLEGNVVGSRIQYRGSKQLLKHVWRLYAPNLVSQRCGNFFFSAL